MRRSLAAALAAVMLAAPAVGCGAAAPLGSDRAFGERVRAYLLAHPEVIQETLAALQAKEEAQTAASARLAIAAHRPQLERDPRDPVGGAAKGAVTMVEFFDYRCPYCKTAAPALPAFLKAHPDVRLVYKEFPILSEASEKAAKLALAAHLQGRYAAVHPALMAAPQLTDAIVDDILTRAGVDVARAKADAASPAVERQIADGQALARTLGVSGTPAFVVGDRVSNGWRPDDLDAAIKAAAARR